MGASWGKPSDPCDEPLEPPNWPTDVPSDVSKFWSETECSTLFHPTPPLPPLAPLTITVPQGVNEWWLTTGSAFFASEFKGFPLPTIVTTSVPQQTPLSSTMNSANQSQTTSPTKTVKASSGTDGTGDTSTRVPTGSLPLSTTPSSSAIVTTMAAVSSSSSVSGSRTETSPPPLPSTPTVSSSPIAARSNNKTIPIVVGVVIPLVLIVLGVVAFILYKRRQRARDRREWERTHEAIADAVRQVGAPAAVGLPAWNPARGDVKEPLDGDAAPLFEKSGGSLPGSLGHSDELLSHSHAPSSLI